MVCSSNGICALLGPLSLEGLLLRIALLAGPLLSAVVQRRQLTAVHAVGCWAYVSTIACGIFLWQRLAPLSSQSPSASIICPNIMMIDAVEEQFSNAVISLRAACGIARFRIAEPFVRLDARHGLPIKGAGTDACAMLGLGCGRASAIPLSVLLDIEGDPCFVPPAVARYCCEGQYVSYKLSYKGHDAFRLVNVTGAMDFDDQSVHWPRCARIDVWRGIETHDNESKQHRWRSYVPPETLAAVSAVRADPPREWPVSAQLVANVRAELRRRDARFLSPYGGLALRTEMLCGIWVGSSKRCIGRKGPYEGCKTAEAKVCARLSGVVESLATLASRNGSQRLMVASDLGRSGSAGTACRPCAPAIDRMLHERFGALPNPCELLQVTEGVVCGLVEMAMLDMASPRYRTDISHLHLFMRRPFENISVGSSHSGPRSFTLRRPSSYPLRPGEPPDPASHSRRGHDYRSAVTRGAVTRGGDRRRRGAS